MIWENSSYLWLLLLLPLIYGGYYWFRLQQRQKRKKLFDDRLIGQLRKNFWSTGDRVRMFAILISMFFFIVALAGPKIGTEVREIQRSGLNIMVAMDLSRSMNAEDVRPNRLDKAKFEVNRLVNRLQGDRIGLIVFSGEAYIQAPITADYSALRLFLDVANTDQMPVTGTNFRSAMERAIEVFDSVERQNASNVLLFIADGENHGPDYDDTLRELTDRGVTVFTVGVGTSEGGPIPIYDDQGRLTGYHRDQQGNTVTTRLEENTMRRIADAGGGEYYALRSGSDTIEPFFARLDELERGEFGSQEYADYENQYQILMMIGMLFFVTGLFFPDHLNRNREIKNS
ncbi:vWA domain-containing protein [Rhodohalobacter halophilus]|uniref:vWA domain-containing protein n=1 Tax=Rhodohalobacter halophilus TaxID=1812810 RepID=UPI00083F9041|nr:VWA domain-containing protein [Rhodohalobacter halophilus]